MIDLDDYFSDFSPEEYVEQTGEYFTQLERENMIEKLREFFDRGCEYSGTQEQIDDWTQETIKELDSKTTSYFDDCLITNYDGSEILGSLDDFVNIFWDKAIEGILNVVVTEN
mgnify:CR=1 FL=1